MSPQAKILRTSRKKEPNVVRAATLSRYGRNWVAAMVAAYRRSMIADALVLPSATPKAKAAVMRSIS